MFDLKLSSPVTIRSLVDSQFNSRLTMKFLESEEKSWTTFLRSNTALNTEVSRLCLIMSLELRAANLEQSDSGYKRGLKRIKFLFNRKVSNTTTFSTTHTFICEDAENLITDSKNWRHISSHNSCWADAVCSEISNAYFALCAEVDRTVAPAKLSTEAMTPIFDTLFSWEKGTVLGTGSADKRTVSFE